MRSSPAPFRLGDEILVRLVVVAIVAGLVVGVARFRPRPRRTPLNVVGTLAGPGVFLFTATGCDSCDAAREIYVRVLGEDGFTELAWEEHPDTFSRLGVDEIPSGCALDAAGRQLGYFTQIPRPFALRRARRKLAG